MITLDHLNSKSNKKFPLNFITNDDLFSFNNVLLDISYLHFKYYCLSRFAVLKPPIPSPSPFCKVSPPVKPFPTHLPALTISYWRGPALAGLRDSSPLWPTRPSSATCAAGAMWLSMCTLWVVV